MDLSVQDSYVLLEIENIPLPIMLPIQNCSQLIRKIKVQGLPSVPKYVRGVMPYRSKSAIVVNISEFLGYQQIYQTLEYVAINYNGEFFILEGTQLGGEINELDIKYKQDLKDFSGQKLFSNFVVLHEKDGYKACLEVDLQEFKSIISQDIANATREIIVAEEIIDTHISLPYSIVSDQHQAQVRKSLFSKEVEQELDLQFRYRNYYFSFPISSILTTIKHASLEDLSPVLHPWVIGSLLYQRQFIPFFNPEVLIKGQDEISKNTSWNLISEGIIVYIKTLGLYVGLPVDEIFEPTIKNLRQKNTYYQFPFMDRSTEQLFDSISWSDGHPVFHINPHILVQEIYRQQLTQVTLNNRYHPPQKLWTTVQFETESEIQTLCVRDGYLLSIPNELVKRILHAVPLFGEENMWFVYDKKIVPVVGLFDEAIPSVADIFLMEKDELLVGLFIDGEIFNESVEWISFAPASAVKLSKIYSEFMEMIDVIGFGNVRHIGLIPIFSLESEKLLTYLETSIEGIELLGDLEKAYQSDPALNYTHYAVSSDDSAKGFVIFEIEGNRCAISLDPVKAYCRRQDIDIAEVLSVDEVCIGSKPLHNDIFEIDYKRKRVLISFNNFIEIDYFFTSEISDTKVVDQTISITNFVDGVITNSLQGSEDQLIFILDYHKILRGGKK